MKQKKKLLSCEKLRTKLWTDVKAAPDALTPASVHSLWRSPTFWDGVILTVLSKLRPSLLVDTFPPCHILFFPARFPLICFDTEPTSQSFQHWPSVVCPRHGRLSVSRLPRDCGCMNWTRIRNAPYLYYLNHNLFKLKLKYCCSLRWWISDFHEL